MAGLDDSDRWSKRWDEQAGRLRQITLNYLAEVLAKAVETGIITSSQRQAILDQQEP